MICRLCLRSCGTLSFVPGGQHDLAAKEAVRPVMEGGQGSQKGRRSLSKWELSPLQQAGGPVYTGALLAAAMAIYNVSMGREQGE